MGNVEVSAYPFIGEDKLARSDSVVCISLRVICNCQRKKNKRRRKTLILDQNREHYYICYSAIQRYAYIQLL